MQPGLRTVQGCLEDALATLRGETTRLTVAGRTDAGVHARGQVASHEGDPARTDPVNALLPPDIRSNGFSNDIGGQLATAAHADAYQKTADAVGAALAKMPGWLAPFATCNQVAAACRDDVVWRLPPRQI